MTNDPYRQWLTERRKLAPPETLTDQIMCQVSELDRQRQAIWWLRVIQHVERSRSGRWAVCGGALAVGSFPLLFLAHFAKFMSF